MLGRVDLIKLLLSGVVRDVVLIAELNSLFIFQGREYGTSKNAMGDDI